MTCGADQRVVAVIPIRGAMATTSRVRTPSGFARQHKDTTMTTVFLSYRRTDTERAVILLRVMLENHLLRQARIFHDQKTLQFGALWLEQIDRHLQRGDICIVVIGPLWLTDAEGQRPLWNPENIHRQEIEKSLERDLTVIPLTVNSAPLPSKQDLPVSIQPLLDWQSYDIQISESGELTGSDKLIDRINFLVRQAIQPARTGERFGEFELVERIHLSGESEVWKVRAGVGQASDAPLSCLKFLSSHRLMGGERVSMAARWRELFERTRSIPRDQPQYRHAERVCEILQYVEDPYRGPGLLLPLIHGRNLHQYRISQYGERGIPWHVAIEIYLRPIAEALDHLHRAGWVHRNVAPTNILLEHHGSVPKMWLIDPSRMTRTGSYSEPQDGYKTVGYRAPEHFFGKPVDGRADLYALVITLCEVLSGRHPFSGSDPVSWDSPERSLRAWLSDLRMTEIAYFGEPTVQHVLLRGLAPRPADRFASCSEFLQAFHDAVSSLSEPAEPSPSKQPGADSGRHVVSPGHQAGEQRRFGDLRFAFRWCPAGRFLMGSPPSEPGRGTDEGGPDGLPLKVELPQGMWFGETPVTNQDWQDVMNDQFGERLLEREFPAQGEQQRRERDRWPVLFIPRDLAEEYCRRLTLKGQEAGWLPRDWMVALPTETQWEYAARAGTTTATPFGPNLGSDQANFNGHHPYNGAPRGRYLGCPVPVDVSRAVNAWGLRDMIGNAYEWCEDQYHPRLGASGLLDTRGGVQYVARGGAWCTAGVHCRSAARAKFNLFDRLRHVGLRVIIIRSYGSDR
jgi:formylglycine-generating enzyme required for sulfatase activity